MAKKIKSSSNRKKWLALLLILVPVGVATPLVISAMSKKDGEAPSDFSPHWIREGDVKEFEDFDELIENSNVYLMDQNDPSSFTFNKELAHDYVEEVMPTAVVIPNPTSSSDTITIDGVVINATVNGNRWDHPLPNVEIYKHASWTESNLVYTENFREAIDYVRESIPFPVSIPNPQSASDTMTIDGVTYGVVNNGYSWDNQLPAESLYNTSVLNSFTTIETNAVDYVAEIDEKKPYMGLDEIFNLPGGAPYDSSLWSWRKTSDGVVGTDAIEEVKPTIMGQEISSVDGGTPYDASNWTWEETTQGSAPTGVRYTGTTQFRLSEQWQYLSEDGRTMSLSSVARKYISDNQFNQIKNNNKWTNLAVGKPENYQVNYDPSLWTYAERWREDVSTSQLSYTIIAYKASYDGKPIQGVVVEIKNASSSFSAPNSVPVVNGQEPALFRSDNSGITVRWGSTTPGSAGTPSTFTPSYNGVAFPSLSQEVRLDIDGNHIDAPTSGVAPSSFDEVASYKQGNAYVPKENGMPAQYNVEYNGIATSHQIVEVPYDGSTAGIAPIGAPIDFTISDYHSGRAHVDEVLPQEVFIDPADYDTTSATIETSSGTSVHTGILGLAWETYNQTSFWEETPGNYVTSPETIPGYIAEVKPTSINLTSTVEGINTNITIRSMGGAGVKYYTTAEIYEFIINGDVYASNGEYTYMLTEADGYIAPNLEPKTYSVAELTTIAINEGSINIEGTKYTYISQ